MHWNLRLTALVLATCGLAACGGGDDNDNNTNPPAPAPAPGPAPAPAPGPAPAPAPAPATLGDTVALTTTGQLISFNRATPRTQATTVNVTGLVRANESLIAIDRRPLDGFLYGLSNAATVYRVDPETGVATEAHDLQNSSGNTTPFTGLQGSNFGIDFNPLNDRLRVVSDTGQNLRVNVDTGAVTTDTNLPAGAAITAAAYTNAFTGTNTSQLEVLDVAAGVLHEQNPQNDGTLDAGVPLGVVADASNGFDIDPRTNTGYAALQVNGVVSLYSINLSATTGAAATAVDVIGNGNVGIRGIALAAVKAPVAIALSSDNHLLSFDPATPNTISSNVTVTGLRAGETLQGIDFRPADRRLYGVTTGAANGPALYTIDPATGAAQFVATLAADPADTSAPFASLDGAITAVDFNPSTDRLRIITSNGQNLRVAVADANDNGTVVTAGQTITDDPINSASGAVSVVAAAHTAGSALQDLEQNADRLEKQSPINSGTLADEGPLGVNITGSAGFDIAGGNNGLALAALRDGTTTGPFSLYDISLSSGQATLHNGATSPALSQIGGATGPANLIDLAIQL